MFDKLYESICLINAFQLSLFGLFLVFHPRGNRLRNRLLAIFLLSKAFCVMNIAVDVFGQSWVWQHFPYLFFFHIHADLLFAPALYMYTRSLTVKNYRLAGKELLHFFFPALSVVYVFIRVYSHSILELQTLLEQGWIFTSTEGIIIDTCVYSVSFIYVILALRSLKAYRQDIRDYFSDLHRVNLSWIQFVLWGFIVIISIATSGWLIGLAGFPSHTFFNFLIELAVFIFANTLVYMGLTTPEVFNVFPLDEKRTKTLLKDADVKRYAEKIEAYMENARPYLMPSININQLAGKIGISPRYLSQVLNEYFGKSFYEFINYYRIRESQQIMRNGECKTVLEILYKVGFNSKSVFNNAFRKQVGMTPSEYMRTCSA